VSIGREGRADICQKWWYVAINSFSGRKTRLFFHILIAKSLPPLCQGDIHARVENRFVARKRQGPGSLQKGTDRMEDARAAIAAAS
jgi:hypothetical protein